VTTTNTILPRAFAAWWKDLHRWGVKSFQSSQWQWPPTVIKKFATALERRFETVDKTSFELRPEHFLKLRFTGEVEQRDLHGKTEFKGPLFFANTGDLIYSKIDVRNGAIGIIPNNVPVATVTSEFPVYRIKKDVALSEYVKLVFRTQHFRRIINGMVSGASGRKRVQPSDLENVEIPFPPLTEQKVIVARWRKAQDKIAAIRNRIVERESAIESRFLNDLGLKPPTEEKKPRCFAVTWQMFDRWDLTYFRRSAFIPKSIDFPNVHLSEVVHPLSETTQRLDPSNFPTSDFNYIGMENVESGNGRLVGNTHRQGAEIKSSCIAFCSEHILYGKLRPYLRKVVDCSELDFDQGIASSEFLSLRPKEMVCQAWLAHYLRSNTVAEQAKIAIGARMPRISIDAFLNIWVPLPPLSVQKQIMERIAAGREKIAREREAAERLTREINAEIEAIILGAKKVGTT